MSARLETIWPALLRRLERASPSKQRAAGVAACEFAIAEAGLAVPLVDEVLSKLRAGGRLHAEDRARLDALAERLDTEYFDLHEASEKGLAREEDVLGRFSQARAVAALSFAGSSDPLEAAANAIYEAAYATRHQERLAAVIEAVIGGL